MKRFMHNSNLTKFARLSIVGALVLVAVSGCARSLTANGVGGAVVTRVDASELPGPEGQLGANQEYVYRIGPNDKLIVDVYGLENMGNRLVTADGNGDITLPIAGLVKLNNLTIGEAATRVQEQLRAGHVRNPRVAINLQEAVSRFVTIDGEVKQAGNYPVVAGMTLMRGVAEARGATDFASLREVVVHRRVNGRNMIALYDLGAIRAGNYPDPVLYPNDIVVVGDSPSRRLFQQIVAVAPLLISPLVAVLDSRR